MKTRRRLSRWWWAAPALALMGVGWLSLKPRSSDAKLRAPVASARLVSEAAPAPRRHVRVDVRGPERALGSVTEGETVEELSEQTSAVVDGRGVSGHVQDVSGGAVQGARVSAVSSGAAAVVGTSDEDGFFHLDAPAGGVQLSATFEAYSVASRWVEAPTSGALLVMAPAAAIAGRVVTASGAVPVAGALVQASGRNGPHASPPPVSSAADGSFALRGLPPGSYSLSVVADHWRHTPHWVSVGVAESLEGVTLEVERGVRLDAAVTVDSQPCAAGRFELSGRDLYVMLVVDGQASVRGLAPGRYAVVVECEGAVPLNDTIEVTTDPAVLDADWDLNAGLSVKGKVSRANDEPFSGARVTVTPVADAKEGALRRSMSTSCVSDALGEFRCGGLTAGEYDCAVTDQSGEAGEAQRVSVSEGQSPRVLLRAAAVGTLLATVEGDGAGPNAEAPIVAQLSAGGPLLSATRKGADFAFENVPLGSYVVFDGATGARSGAAATVRLESDGQVASVTIRIPTANATVEGRVVDEANQPVVDAWVSASSTDLVRLGIEGGQRSLTNGNGEFSLTAVDGQVLQVEVTSSRGEARAALRAGDRDATIKLLAYGSLTGTVRTASGEPAERATLSVSLVGGQGLSLDVTDGTFAVPWTPPGRYELSVESATGVTASTEVVLQPGASETVSLLVAPAPR